MRKFTKRPGQDYDVTLCRNCSHPGGLHILGDGCRCGFCGGWSEGGTGRWSDAMTRQLEIDAGITREGEDG